MLQAEFDRLHEENRKLRSLLGQITKSCTELQSQLILAMQNQAHGSPREQVSFTFYLTILVYHFWRVVIFQHAKMTRMEISY